MVRSLRYFLQVQDWQSLAVLVLALASTFACQHFGIVADIPTSLIGLAVVFPIVFSINSAYKRREEALRYHSGLKTHLVALYWAHRDWIAEDRSEAAHLKRVRETITELLGAIRADLQGNAREQGALERVLGVFSSMSRLNEEARRRGMSAGEVSRANQFLTKAVGEYERLRNIAAYRTPLSLRAYSSVFLNLFPVAFGPYFAHLIEKNPHFPYVGYIVAALYSLVLVSLDNIQEDLEDPFDGVGPDDVHLDTEHRYRKVFEH